MYLPSLSNAELVRHAEAVRDPLTTTDLEIELCNRLADTDDLEALRDLADALGLETPDDFHALKEVMADFYIDSPAALRSKLERSDKFYDIAIDAGDVISRLNDLINSTL
jgi:hypothetical protein